MEFYQWLGPLVALFFILRVIQQYRRNDRLFVSTIIWATFWVGIALLSIFPDLVSFNIAAILGFKSNINAIIFLALGFLFILTYYATSMFEKLETQMTELVRKMAIENQELKDKLHEFEKNLIQQRQKEYSTKELEVKKEVKSLVKTKKAKTKRKSRSKSSSVQEV